MCCDIACANNYLKMYTTITIDFVAFHDILGYSNSHFLQRGREGGGAGKRKRENEESVFSVNAKVQTDGKGRI